MSNRILRISQFLVAGAFAVLIAGCGKSGKYQDEAQKFLDGYNAKYQQLYTGSSETQWQLNTHLVEGDSVTKKASDKAQQAFADYTGSNEVINQVKALLEHQNDLTPLQVKQLNKILYIAAGNPESEKALIKDRIDAESAQTASLYSFRYTVGGKEVSTNQIDSILVHSKNEQERLNAWLASKEVGKTLKSGLVKLQKLRNASVKGLGYPDFFTYQASDYGMKREEMMELMKQMMREIWPLYRELHTYARYELAARYGAKEVPDMLPAHWLPNRWGQDWSSMVTVQGLNLDSVLATKNAEWIMTEAENFYVSLGMPKLPPVFYEKSSLYPLPPGTPYKKNNHASAWHMNLDKDVRSLMSVEPNAEWYETVHHELGHIYYYLAYSNPNVPMVLREGANRAYHEAVGSMLGLAAMQQPFLASKGLVPANSTSDQTQKLLKDALNYIVFIPFSAGVMSHFEHDLYAGNLDSNAYNQRWWELAAQYQGIVPPAERGEMYCDAATKTHINDDAAQYYDYALSYILLFQLHDHIAKHILKQDPHNTNYYGSKETGKFLTDLLSQGGVGDWRAMLKSATGEELSARAMLEYFAPLTAYLKKVNQGRKYTLPEQVN